MSVVLQKLYKEYEKQFRLSLCAGQDSIRNEVSWAYVLEDEYLIRYFHGAELAVTSGIRLASDPGWLMTLVRELVERQASGLIINTGKYITKIPQEIIDYCNANDFPLLTMPWEIHITDVIKEFCMHVISEQYESVQHDEAMRHIILSKQGGSEEDREILSRYYQLDGKFTAILIYVKPSEESSQEKDGLEHRFLNQIRRFKMKHGLKRVRVGLISYENYELMILNNMDTALLPEIGGIIFRVFEAAHRTNALFMGAGIEVSGISNIHKSYSRAQTALRMAIYRQEPYVRFEDMGFYKLLFSVKDDELLFSYANEILAPLDACGAKGQEFLELLKSYIENDRSLERTAQALYLHRNTVNYRVQKLKGLLDSPLKTVNDLFPYQVALAIRDMEDHTNGFKL